ncbi:MAG: radical SAM protein [Desulfovibrionales bacterium]|nr:radical SAM protein [Desulfovibrionales bacterium]
MKIQLINPCMNSDYEENSRNGVIHPLGLLSVAAYVKQCIPSVEIEVLDGSIMSREEINARIAGDIVGCTTGVLNYDHTLEIARIARDGGAKIVFGGALANELATAILTNRPEVDWVVRGDGEHAMAALVMGVAPESIPNLVWRGSSGIVVNEMKQVLLDAIPIADRDLLTISQYYENYIGINVTGKFQHPMSFYSGKGCSYATTHGRCVFCARMDRGFRSRKPELVWAELKYLADKFGADAFWDVADSVLSDEVWMQQFEALKPSDFSPHFLIYGRADAVTSESAQRLRRLNCHLVFIGFESGSDEILSRVGYGKTIRQAKKAALLLADNGIQIMASFVLGLPGETQRSIEQTIEFAHWLGSLGNLETVSGSVIIPLPGSQVFSLIRKVYPEKYRGKDYFDLEEARHDWLSSYTAISINNAYDALPRLLNAGKVGSSLGRPRVITQRQ